MAVRNGYPDMALGEMYPFEDHYTTLDDGHSMHHIEAGSAGLWRPTFLLLHGNPTWSFLYRRFMHPLSRLGRVVAIDHVGYGRSDHPADVSYHTLERHIANLEEFVQKRRLKRVIPVMQDWGGPIGLGWATRHPDMLRAMVVMNTWAFVRKIEMKPPWWFRAMSKGAIGRTLLQRRNTWIDTILPRLLQDRPSADVMAGYRHPFTSPRGRAALLAAPRMIPYKEDHPDWSTMAAIEEALPSLDVPAMILWAVRDPAFGKRYAWAFHELLPQAQEPRWLDAGHFLQEDAPTEVVSHIEAFARSL